MMWIIPIVGVAICLVTFVSICRVIFVALLIADRRHQARMDQMEASFRHVRDNLVERKNDAH